MLMIVQGYIQTSLKQLEKLYDSHQSLRKDIYYSKIALIELCGWVEDSLDHLIRFSVVNKLRTSDYKKILTRIIKRNHGFDYDNNFRPMLIQVVGILKAESIENKVNRNGDIDKLRAHLSYLKELRNKNAHTFIKSNTNNIPSPSVSLSYFNDIFPILKKIENEIKR